MLTALPEPGTLQIWTGLMARTRPNWHLLLRAPANLPTPGGFTLYEGIVASDQWFGPLFTNLRFTRTHVPVRLRPDFPLIQAQPVHRMTYDNITLNAMTMVADMSRMESIDWDDYRTTIVLPNRQPERPYGGYAVETRKRRPDPRIPAVAGTCPFATAKSHAGAVPG
jgi:hypothetical protein